jgi:hypothetical protein
MRLAVRVETGDVRWLGGSITNGDVSFLNTGERQQKTRRRRRYDCSKISRFILVNLEEFWTNSSYSEQYWDSNTRVPTTLARFLEEYYRSVAS